MIFSAQDEFSNKQAVTASAASTNYIDLLATGTPYGAAAALNRDLGKGGKIPLHIQVTTAFATLTSLKVAVQTDDNSSFSSAATILETEAIAAATLIAGYVFNIDSIPLKASERYIRLYYTVAGSDATAGNVQAGITMGNQQAPI
jgi:hypothetical protein